MGRFLVGRVLTSLLSIIGATYFVFVLTLFHDDPTQLYIGENILDQDAIDALRARLGLDQPWFIRYFVWFSSAVRGDFGESIGRSQPVSSIIQGKFGATVELAIGAWIFAIALGVPAGVIAAVKRGGWPDYAARGIALIGQAAPAFVTALVLIWVFAVLLQWLPASNRPAEFDIRYYILPSIALGWSATAGLMRLTRSSMLEVLDSEFVKLARAKGVANYKVIAKHALRNSLIAPVTSLLLLFSGWLNGALVIEIVFAWPGLGTEALQNAVNDNDFPLLMGTVFLFAFIFLIFATVADILYTIIDPRVRIR